MSYIYSGFQFAYWELITSEIVWFWVSKISASPAKAVLAEILSTYLIWNFLFRYPTCFVIGIMLILIVFAFWGYKTFYRNVRTESITPVRSADTNHYEMKNTNTVLASSGNGHGVDWLKRVLDKIRKKSRVNSENVLSWNSIQNTYLQWYLWIQIQEREQFNIVILYSS